MSRLFVHIFAFALIHQMLSLASYAKLHRGPRGFDTTCCKVEKSPARIQYEEEVKNMLKECDEELGKPEGKPRGRMFCLTECMAKKVNALNEDNTLNEDASKELIANKLATQDYQKAVAADVAAKCIEEVKMASQEQDASENPSGCSKVPKKLFMCVSREFFKACPEDLQDKSESCEKMREMVINGKPPKDQ